LDNLEELRAELVGYIRRKFYTRRNITDMADEVVNAAFLNVAKSANFDAGGHYNFGYMSVACIRAAYRVFHRNDRDGRNTVPFELAAPLVDEDSFVDEIANADDTAFILQSLQTLKDVERVIVSERYYGGFTFREISERHNINLNTVLSHHRRALEKLRPVLAQYFDFRGDTDYHYGKKFKK